MDFETPSSFTGLEEFEQCNCCTIETIFNHFLKMKANLPLRNTSYRIGKTFSNSTRWSKMWKKSNDHRRRFGSTAKISNNLAGFFLFKLTKIDREINVCRRDVTPCKC